MTSEPALTNFFELLYNRTFGYIARTQKKGESVMKTAIVVLSDPKTGTEEALGRVFNALATAYDFKQKGQEVEIVFQGAGTRWPAELAKPDHPAHELYEAVGDTVAGVSCACADVFGAAEEAEESGLELIKENPVPGTRGLASLQRFASEGATVLTF